MTDDTFSRFRKPRPSFLPSLVLFVTSSGLLYLVCSNIYISTMFHGEFQMNDNAIPRVQSKDSRSGLQIGLSMPSTHTSVIAGRQSNSTTERTNSLCIENSEQFGEDDVTLTRIRVAKETSDAKSVRVLCFVLSHSGNHASKVAGVWETWGRKCDKFVVYSNQTDPSVHAVKTTTGPSYKDLWHKLRDAVGHILEHYANDYDFFLKADDDTYVVLENLRASLMMPQVQQLHATGQPLLAGRLFGRHIDSRMWNPRNPKLQEKKRSILFYPSGGSGYIMNRQYLSHFVQLVDSYGMEIQRQAPEDMANSLLSTFYGDIHPVGLRDLSGKELFHPGTPAQMNYPKDKSVLRWMLEFHEPVGGLKLFADCCSAYSVTFHHVRSRNHMRYIDNKIYGRTSVACPADMLDIN